MKTIGMIGGMSWESSLEYYRIVNETVRDKRGSLSSAKCILYSVDFSEIEKLQVQERWKELTDEMIKAGMSLKNAGADFLIICTNTMHLMADEVQKAAGLKLLHIAEAAGDAAAKKGMKKVGLLGTRFTMEKDFYQKSLLDGFGIETIIPEKEERDEVHRVIYEELCAGIIRKESRDAYQQIIKHLCERGAEGIVLGCTEIPLLIQQKDSSIPIFDTIYLHARRAAEYALE